MLNLIVWVSVIIGCVNVVGALADLYMLLIVGVNPGDPIYLDELAPSIRGALLHLGYGLLWIAVPFIARALILRRSKVRKVPDKIGNS